MSIKLTRSALSWRGRIGIWTKEAEVCCGRLKGFLRRKEVAGSLDVDKKYMKALS